MRSVGDRIRVGRDLRDKLAARRGPAHPTISSGPRAAGIAVSVVSGAQFTGSGLTRAVLRGGRYVGVHALGDLAASVRSAFADGGFCYGYHSELDLLGHVYGPGSTAWRMQLRHVDRLVESIVEGLPPGVCSPWWPTTAWLPSTLQRWWISTPPSPCLTASRQSVASRGPGMSTSPTGAADSVLAAWRETLGAAGVGGVA